MWLQKKMISDQDTKKAKNQQGKSSLILVTEWYSAQQMILPLRKTRSQCIWLLSRHGRWVWWASSDIVVGIFMKFQQNPTTWKSGRCNSRWLPLLTIVCITPYMDMVKVSDVSWLLMVSWLLTLTCYKKVSGWWVVERWFSSRIFQKHSKVRVLLVGGRLRNDRVD